MRSVFSTITILLLLSQMLLVQGIEIRVMEVERRIVTVYAPAVAQLENGSMSGSLSSIQITVQSNGSGLVFVDTRPLTEIDMQGSARLAVNVAGAVTGIDISDYDFYFVVRSEAPIIGGPSAGATMCMGVIATLENWNITNKTMLTGMINPDGSIGPVGGILYKAQAVAEAGAKRFLIPYGQSMVPMSRTITHGWISYTETYYMDIIEYAKNSWNLEVVEIKDIYDAIEYMAGYRVNRTIAPIEKSEEYRAVMRELAGSLMNRANDSFSSASRSFSNYTFSVMGDRYHSLVKSYYVKAQEAINKSVQAYAEENYYTTSSRAFQASWYSRFVIHASEFFGNETIGYIKGRLDEASERIESAKEDVMRNTANITGITQLQSFGGAQERIFEAEERIEKASRILNNPRPTYDDCINSLMDCAYASERSETALWWVEIGIRFAGNQSINATMLRYAAEEYIGGAEEIIAYAGALGISTGNMIKKSRDALNKDINPLALFYSIEAYVDVTNSIEIYGYKEIPQWKLDKAREGAQVAIEESRRFGVEPVLAISYYEFAESLDKPEDQIIYFKYASMIAGLSGFILNAKPRIQEWQKIEVGDGEAQAHIEWWAIIMVFGSGIVLGLSFSVLFIPFGKGGKRKRRRRIYRRI